MNRQCHGGETRDNVCKKWRCMTVLSVRAMRSVHVTRDGGSIAHGQQQKDSPWHAQSLASASAKQLRV